jgi:hypothetical protein
MMEIVTASLPTLSHVPMDTTERGATEIIAKPGTLGADKNYDTGDFVTKKRRRKMTPHASKEKYSVIDRHTPPSTSVTEDR